MNEVLITGGCGFIGSNLVEYLLSNTNWNINVLDNLSTGSLKFIEDIKKAQNNNRVLIITVRKEDQVQLLRI